VDILNAIPQAHALRLRAASSIFTSLYSMACLAASSTSILVWARDFSGRRLVGRSIPTQGLWRSASPDLYQTSTHMQVEHRPRPSLNMRMWNGTNRGCANEILHTNILPCECDT